MTAHSPKEKRLYTCGGDYCPHQPKCPIAPTPEEFGRELLSSKKDLGALIRKVSARIPASVTPATRINIHPAEWLELSNAFL